MANEVMQISTSIQALDWTKERDDLVAKAHEIAQVTTDDELEIAGSVQAKCSKLIKRLESERKKLTDPLNSIKTSIMAQEKELCKDLEKELMRVKALTTAYATEQARKAKEERRRIEEAERRAAEAQMAAEQAKAADPFGFNGSTPEAAPTITPVPMATVQRPHTSANRFVERWDFVVVDESKVPRQLLSVDEHKIRTVLAAKKAEGYEADQIVIDGLKISATMQVCGR